MHRTKQLQVPNLILAHTHENDAKEEKQWALTAQKVKATWGLGLFDNLLDDLGQANFFCSTLAFLSLFFFIHLNWKLLGWGLAPNVCSNRS